MADPAGALAEALRKPVEGAALAQLARPGQKVVIAVPDGTRPHPHRMVLEALLTELAAAGADSDVTVLIAGGTHAADPPDVIAAMLGPEVPRRCKVAIHDCRDTANLVPLGPAAPPAGDVPVALDRRWVEADLRISSGLVEPHLFAGFSGGPKLAAIGTAGLDTVMALHNGRRVGDPKATWGIVEGNPVHDAIRAVAALAPAHFSLELVLDSQKRLTHAFAGPTRVGAPGGGRHRPADHHGPGPRPVSPGDHVVRRRSARPEPVSGHQGGGRGRRHGRRRGHHHPGRGMRRRSPQLRHVHRRAPPR